ncbi:sodium:solute symporter family transporter [Zobellella denitrificans]
MNADFLVVGGYFSLMIVISLAFKKMASNSTSDYFRGGGRMLWWMVGATAFMTQFSAWTFTGAAGKAYTDGLAVMGVFIGNICAYLVSYWWFSHRFRQMRVDTPTEGIRRRFGRGNEQFFTWAILPLSVLNAAVWLNGLSIFASVLFKVDIVTTIYVTGLAVLLVSLLSGAWGVVASDFVQTLVVAVVSVACAIVALVLVGGPATIVTDFPDGFVMGRDMNYGVLILGTFLFFIVKQMQSINNMQDAYRFLNAKDSNNARKAALLALVMMVFGSVLWFIPPWAAAILYPDAGTVHTELGGKAADAVYLVFAERAMPLGTVGLLMAGLFAATMSSMDSALNRNSGIFVRSFYAPILRKGKVSDKEMLRVGQLACLINGVLVILMAQFFQSLKHLSLFDLMMQVATLLQSPILVPLFFGMFIRRVPDWAAWATVLFGMFVSFLLAKVFTVPVIGGWFGLSFTGREISDLSIIVNVGTHLVLTGGFFCLTTLCYRERRGSAREARVERFFEDIETPVVADEAQDEFDRLQRCKLGKLSMMMGLGLSLMVLIPNPLWGRLLFLCCAGAVFLLGYLLHRSSLSPAPKAASRHQAAPLSIK